MPELPEFVEPMLAKLGREPFDSDEHRFEVKWDGTRSLCFTERGDYRLRNRKANDQRPRYPELGFLADLPSGLVLDGEIVVMRDGRPDFHGMLQREQARDPRKVQLVSQSLPATYVVFDLLYREGLPRLERPLSERVEELSEVVSSCGDPRLVFSDGVVGLGKLFFEGIRARAIEGVVAKRLASPYLPGRRTDAWIKIKPVQLVHCAVIGWERDDAGGVKSLVIALEEGGSLRCVGKVGSGLTEDMRARLLADLPRRSRPTSIVPLGARGAGGTDGAKGASGTVGGLGKAEWVEPGLFCTVGYLERTSEGNLRAPVLRELFEDERWSASEPPPTNQTGPTGSA